MPLQTIPQQQGGVILMPTSIAATFCVFNKRCNIPSMVRDKGGPESLDAFTVASGSGCCSAIGSGTLVGNIVSVGTGLPSLEGPQDLVERLSDPVSLAPTATSCLVGTTDWSPEDLWLNWEAAYWRP